MRTYRELYFRGTSKQLSDFVESFRSYNCGDWKVEKQTEQWKDYLFFDYLGDAFSYSHGFIVAFQGVLRDGVFQVILLPEHSAAGLPLALCQRAKLIKSSCNRGGKAFLSHAVTAVGAV